MRASFFIPRPQIGEYPKCAKCSAQMWISRIEPDKPDHDKRTFECPACDGVMTAIVHRVGNHGRAGRTAGRLYGSSSSILTNASDIVVW